ncbi:FxsA family protein [Lentibacillus sp. Marseille-P4043]|uniref:FxsA family protein n=1 Tax=Lentibacillus sp. Marseille-P4043 TaxID=2040293 RepID=UPI000D0B1F0C|nr:FxsA family protein [Lentibacillus sp. Marseille-P4043]
MRWLLLALLIIPALEIGVFVWAGGIIGPWWVVFLILLTGIVGVTIAKQQGTETWMRARQLMTQGHAPTAEIIDGICIFVGAVFLFSPGFITDTIGFLLVLPWTRIPFRSWLQRFIKNKMNKGTIIYRKW